SPVNRFAVTSQLAFVSLSLRPFSMCIKVLLLLVLASALVCLSSGALQPLTKEAQPSGASNPTLILIGNVLLTLINGCALFIIANAFCEILFELVFLRGRDEYEPLASKNQPDEEMAMEGVEK